MQHLTFFEKIFLNKNFQKDTRIHQENLFEIYELKFSGLSVRKMAGIIGKHPSTISRELKVKAIFFRGSPK